MAKLVDTSLITVRKKDDSKEYYRQYRHLLKQNPDTSQHLRNRMLIQRYGITQQDYDKMLEDQGGVCAICGTDSPGGFSRKFHVDHCHTTEEIRGLLCNHCNQGLGHFKDDINSLQNAITYLQKESHDG